MSDEFNIYNNLNLIGECNFSTQIKQMVAANCSNDCQIIDDNFDDFDTMVSSTSLETRTRNNVSTKGDQEKKSKKEAVRLRSSSWKDGSVSPPLQLPVNMTDVWLDSPVSGRTRRSLGKSKTNTDLSANCNNIEILSDEETTHVTTSAKRGRGRGRGRGGGRGRNAKKNGTITLDSDGEQEHPRTRGKKKNTKSTAPMQEALLDISLDEDNPELSIKINWNGKPEAFKMRKYQKFLTLFKLLAEREATDMETMVFNLNDRIILPDDTPDSIEYKIFQFINGRVMARNDKSLLGPVDVPKKQRNPNQIRLKIQSDSWKRPLLIDIMKSDKFRVLYVKCAVELNVGIQHINLSFDGEYLDINGTPADLDLEGGEAIDLRLKN